MRVVFSTAVLFALLLAVPEVANACTCVAGSLSKRFRKAEATFVGRLSTDPDITAGNVQNFAIGLPVLEVVNPFKGIKKRYVAIDLDFEGATPGGTCPWLSKFETGVEYLVFAYGKNLKVIVECSDTRPLKSRYDNTTEEISKLNSRWFRTKARLWPF